MAKAERLSDQVTVADVQALIENNRLDGGIFIGFQFERKDGLVLVTWGRNQAFCQVMQCIGDQLFDQVQAGKVKVTDGKG